MVKATGKLRKFDVELREKGRVPRVVATEVTMDVARTMCRQLVGPSIHAVVRPSQENGPKEANEPVQRYAIWLWNDSLFKWERIQGRQGLRLEQAAAWLQSQHEELRDRMTMVAPAHLSSPAEMLHS